ncbi:hypothetical protein [Hyphomonas sp. UBA3195]|uniref:hypothetical protein n=2 Tax=unclassified Hyphomonas TaxID=2630699 RepID=UPI0025B871D4|nr:hypothetical protein [Hyphomonas sp. UBA3195]
MPARTYPPPLRAGHILARMDSLFAPPPVLKPHLQPFRFWIWLQLILLRLYVRRTRGRGTPFLTMCDARGNVWIAAIGDMPTVARPDPLAFTLPKACQVAMGSASEHAPAHDAGDHRVGTTLFPMIRPHDAELRLPPPDT